MSEPMPVDINQILAKVGELTITVDLLRAKNEELERAMQATQGEPDRIALNLANKEAKK